MSLNIITNRTHAHKPVVIEISSPSTYTDTDDCIVLYYIYYIVLYYIRLDYIILYYTASVV